MSDLKIFIVGPVAAGKTVFACLLNSYITSHPECGVALKAADWKTRKHFAEIHAALGKEPWWPVGTTRGALTELRWRWRFGSSQALFNLVDPPGEDIERELRGESDSLRIRQKIETADVLFVLMDLYGHQGDPGIKRAQNAWIVEHTLDHASAGTQIVIGLSKGDMMKQRLPAEAWTDKDQLMSLISEMMPEFNLPGYRQQLTGPNVRLVMFSAVDTEPYLDSQGTLRQRPRIPFQSTGLDIFVQTITQTHNKRVRKRRIRDAFVRVKRILAASIFWRMVIGLAAAYIFYWFVASVF